jgi:LysR family hydrogen peroxide-inducible transcriptional activator
MIGAAITMQPVICPSKAGWAPEGPPLPRRKCRERLMCDLPSLRQFDHFVAMDEAGSFRAAAERCGISQPSLSVQLASLDRVLHLRLVERGRSGVILTPARRAVLERARTLRAGMREIMELSAVIRSGLAGAIRDAVRSRFGDVIQSAG